MRVFLAYESELAEISLKTSYSTLGFPTVRALAVDFPMGQPEIRNQQTQALATHSNKPGHTGDPCFPEVQMLAI